MLGRMLTCSTKGTLTIMTLVLVRVLRFVLTRTPYLAPYAVLRDTVIPVPGTMYQIHKQEYCNVNRVIHSYE